MFLKFKYSDTSSKIVHECTTTFANEETAIHSYFSTPKFGKSSSQNFIWLIVY